jgi:hypothetical protein
MEIAMDFRKGVCMYKNLACIIRTWSNNPNIVSAVKRALEAGIGYVIVVVKDDVPEEKKHPSGLDYKTWLEPLMNEHINRLTVLSMKKYYHWSPALNYGFGEVVCHNLISDQLGTSQIEYVLNVSLEAEYGAEHIDAMVKEMESDTAIAAVGTTFSGHLDDQSSVELGTTYSKPRNTMMMVSLAAYMAVGGYDPRCDAHGGQEDFEWLGRLPAANYRYSMLPLGVPLLIGRNFNQAEKEKREQGSIIKIRDMKVKEGVYFEDEFLNNAA